MEASNQGEMILFSAKARQSAFTLRFLSFPVLEHRFHQYLADSLPVYQGHVLLLVTQCVLLAASIMTPRERGWRFLSLDPLATAGLFLLFNMIIVLVTILCRRRLLRLPECTGTPSRLEAVGATETVSADIFEKLVLRAACGIRKHTSEIATLGVLLFFIVGPGLPIWRAGACQHGGWDVFVFTTLPFLPALCPSLFKVWCFRTLFLASAITVVRLFFHWKDHPDREMKYFAVGLDFVACILCLMYSWGLDKCLRTAFQTAMQAQVEEKHLQKLLHRMLPPTTINRLLANELVAEHFDLVTIMFVEIVDFVAWARIMPPMELVSLLNQVFRLFDNLTDKHNVFKVESVGHVYVAAGGLPEVSQGHAISVVDLALAMHRLSKRRPTVSALTGLPLHNSERCTWPDGSPIQFKIGVHCGPVVAGVICRRLPRYRLFGDTVNTASRMCSLSAPGKIHASATIEPLLHHSFSLASRGTIQVKGKGPAQTFWVNKKYEPYRLASHLRTPPPIRFRGGSSVHSYSRSVGDWEGTSCNSSVAGDTAQFFSRDLVPSEADDTASVSNNSVTRTTVEHDDSHVHPKIFCPPTTTQCPFKARAANLRLIIPETEFITFNTAVQPAPPVAVPMNAEGSPLLSFTPELLSRFTPDSRQTPDYRLCPDFLAPADAAQPSEGPSAPRSPRASPSRISPRSKVVYALPHLVISRGATDQESPQLNGTGGSRQLITTATTAQTVEWPRQASPSSAQTPTPSSRRFARQLSTLTLGVDVTRQTPWSARTTASSPSSVASDMALLPLPAVTAGGGERQQQDWENALRGCEEEESIENLDAIVCELFDKIELPRNMSEQLCWDLNFRNPELEAKYNEDHRLPRTPVVLLSVASALTVVGTVFLESPSASAAVLAAAATVVGVLCLFAGYGKKKQMSQLARLVCCTLGLMLLSVSASVLTSERATGSCLSLSTVFHFLLAITVPLWCGQSFKHGATTLILVWTTLFTTCVIHGDVTLGLIAVLLLPPSLFLLFRDNRMKRYDFLQSGRMQERHKRSRDIVSDLLPDKIAHDFLEARSNTRPVCHKRDEVSVMFADMVGFTAMSATMSPEALVQLLQVVFSVFDELSAKYGVFKVETIGDCYFAASGIPEARPDHAVALGRMALAVQERMQDFELQDGKGLQFRVGLHSGPIVAGVVGFKMPRYHLFGENVEKAAAVECAGGGSPGYVNVTESFKTALEQQVSEEERSEFHFLNRSRTTEDGEALYWLCPSNGADVAACSTPLPVTPAPLTRSQKWSGGLCSSAVGVFPVVEGERSEDEGGTPLSGLVQDRDHGLELARWWPPNSTSPNVELHGKPPSVPKGHSEVDWRRCSMLSPPAKTQHFQGESKRFPISSSLVDGLWEDSDSPRVTAQPISFDHEFTPHSEASGCRSRSASQRSVLSPRSPVVETSATAMVSAAVDTSNDLTVAAGRLLSFTMGLKQIPRVPSCERLAVSVSSSGSSSPSSSVDSNDASVKPENSCFGPEPTPVWSMPATPTTFTPRQGGSNHVCFSPRSIGAATSPIRPRGLGQLGWPSAPASRPETLCSGVRLGKKGFDMSSESMSGDEGATEDGESATEEVAAVASRVQSLKEMSTSSTEEVATKGKG